MNEVQVHHKHTSALLAFFSHNGKYLISYTDFMSSNWVLDPVYYLIKLYDSCLQNVFCTLNPSMKTYFFFCKFIYNTRREACHLAKTCILWLHKKFYGTLRHNWNSGCGLGTFWSRCTIQLPHTRGKYSMICATGHGAVPPLKVFHFLSLQFVRVQRLYKLWKYKRKGNNQLSPWITFIQ